MSTHPTPASPNRIDIVNDHFTPLTMKTNSYKKNQSRKKKVLFKAGHTYLPPRVSASGNEDQASTASGGQEVHQPQWLRPSYEEYWGAMHMSADDDSLRHTKLRPAKSANFSLDDFGDLFVTAVPFKEEINIHIRHFKQSNGRYFATKKGVTFPLPRWVKFESLLPELEKYLQNKESSSEMKWHIGGSVYVSLHPGYSTVDIRHFWKPEDAVDPVPTRKGVTLNKQKVTRLLQAAQEVRECVPELNDTELCAFSESHQNQLGMLSCPECTPFGYEPKETNMSMECNASDTQDAWTIELDTE
uniref:Uncharacterized protein n=1 Tax=Magallana gigas TaxID=29159 RepID=K1QKF7_MAGGI